MKNTTNIFFALLGALAVALAAQADTVKLKNGLSVQGTVLEQTNNSVKIQSEIGVPLTFFSEEIDTVEMTSNAVKSGSAARTETPAPEVRSQSLSDQIFPLLQNEEYSQAHQDLNQWQETHPEDKAAVEALRVLTQQLEAEPSKDIKAAILLNYNLSGFKDTIDKLQHDNKVLQAVPKPLTGFYEPQTQVQSPDNPN